MAYLPVPTMATLTVLLMVPEYELSGADAREDDADELS